MTPSEIITMARRRLNASSDTFWSDDELLGYIYACELELATKALTIESTDTSLVSVADQEDYTLPTGIIRVKRITYAGDKLSPIGEAQNDTLTISNPSSNTSGTPQFYRLWGTTLSLTPIPAASNDAIKIWYWAEPTQVTAASTLDTPTSYHEAIANYGVPSLMVTKEVGDPRAGLFATAWARKVLEIVGTEKKRRRGDRYSRVKCEEELELTNIGPV